jgi:hypothetical protein
MSDIAIRQVGPKAAIKAITKAISKRRPLFLWGAPGIGKSEIMQLIGNSTIREVIDIRLPLWEPTDVKGMPFYNPQSGKMEWAPPVELPTDPESTAIIFLDELNAAPPAVQAAAYQLVLNRRVGTYVLPKGVDIVAAGNRDSDRGVTYRMPKPLANRFLHLEMKPDFDDWFDWATLNKVHEDVVGYLGFAKQDLFDFDPKSSSHAFATPRSWSFVSDLLDDDDLDSDTLMDLVSGAVGDGLAVKFMAHRKIAGKLPKADDILDGKEKGLEIKEVSAMYSLTVSLCYELKDRAEKKAKDWDKMADRFFRYMMDNFPTELVVMGAKTALTNYNLPLDANKMESFDEFHNRFGKYVVTAMENS